MKRIIICFFAVLFCFNVFSFEGQTEVYNMENGLTVILRETHSAPMIAMEAWVKAGSITERNKMGSGLSHYFEHMLFKGTKKRGPGEIAQSIHKAGGSDMNAYTSLEKTVYHYTILSKYQETGVDILSDMLRNSVFDKEEAEKEQKVILKEINMKDDEPDSMIYWELMANAYQVFPYKYPVIGYENLFKQLTSQDIKDYYKTMYSPSNVIVSMVGDFNMNNMKSMIEKYFGGWERMCVPPIALPEEPEQVVHRNIEKPAKINISRAMMGYHSVSITHPDLYALDCLSYILGSGETSRLYKRLIEKEKIALKVYSSSWTPQYAGLFMVKAYFNEENYTKVKFAIQDEINRFKYELVTQKDLEIIKNNVLAYNIYSKESFSSQASDLASSYFSAGSIDFNDKYIDGIKKVTPEDIKRVARKYLNYTNMTTIHMFPEKEETVINSESVKVKRNEDVTKLVLDNNMTVLLKEDKKLPMISVVTGFHGGLRVEDEKNNGISNMAVNMITLGSKKYSKDKIRELEKETGSSISASSGNNSMFVSLKTLEKNFQELWPVYVDIIKNNKFSKKDFDNRKDMILSGIKQSKEDINYRNSVLYRKHVFANHPYAMEKSGTEETVGAFTPEMVQRFIEKHIVSSNATITVTGDFNTEKMAEIIKKSFRDFRNTDYTKPLKVKADEIKGKQTFVENMEGKKQSIVRLVFRGISVDNQDKYALSVVSNVLSGLGSRLFENLRSKYSLAYSVYAGPFNGIDTGAFTFYIATTPEKRDFAIDMMKKEIIKIKKELITEEELERAINKLLGSNATSMQNTMDLAEGLTLDEMYGLGYKATFEFKEEIQKVTRQDVKRVANKYFDLDNYVIAIVEPAK